MKKITISVLLFALFLTACGQDNEQNNSMGESGNIENNSSEDLLNEEDAKDTDHQEGESTAPSKANNQEDMKKMMEELNFTEIEVEISYGKDKEFEFEIEHHSNGDIEAEVEDELNGIDIDNDLEAFNHVYPNVKKLEIDQGTDKQEVIKQVLEAFDLKDNYEEFEVEFKFEDGTKLSYED